jgi:hypothetical protein
MTKDTFEEYYFSNISFKVSRFCFVCNFFLKFADRIKGIFLGLLLNSFAQPAWPGHAEELLVSSADFAV